MKNNPKNRQAWILEELKKNPLLSFGEIFTLYLQNFTKKLSRQILSKDYNIALKQLEIYQKELQTEKERVSIEVEKEAVKQGLKTKIDRLFVLQEQVEQIQKELEANECEDIKIIKGEPKKFKRSLLPMEKASMRKTLKELQSEISKIEGDYAPIKQDHTTNGEAIGERTITFITIDENGDRIVEASN